MIMHSSYIENIIIYSPEYLALKFHFIPANFGKVSDFECLAHICQHILHESKQNNVSLWFAMPRHV